MKPANLVLRFALELCAIAALVYFGTSLDVAIPVKIIVTLAAAGAFVAAWGRWIAPKANARPDPERLAVELLLFAAAVGALAAAGRGLLAAIFVALRPPTRRCCSSGTNAGPPEAGRKPSR